MPTAFARLLRATLITGVVDGLFACAMFLAFQGPALIRVWQGIASTVLGRAAYDGGVRTAGLGVLMHFGVALFWSAVFLLLVSRSTWLRQTVRSVCGKFLIAAIYGPVIWMVMSLIVIPALVQRAPSIAPRWWVYLLGHVFFVGIPIVVGIGSGVRQTTEGRSHAALGPMNV